MTLVECSPALLRRAESLHPAVVGGPKALMSARIPVIARLARLMAREGRCRHLLRQRQSLGQVAGLVCVVLLLSTTPAGAYSVIAHLGAVDATWDGHIAGLLKQRFGRLSSEQLKEARAYAYGGALIQDLGYYPFGSHLFTDLTHYVRSGDFVESLIRNARDPDEYAFALGALAHYAFDNTGHPVAVNRAVPIMYPKVKAKVGSRALYVDSPSRHLMVEFAFDVLQVAGGGLAAQDYHDRIGFHVSKRVLEQAVLETYGVEL